MSVPGYPARGGRESQAPGFERAFGRCGCRPGIRVRPDHCSGGVRWAGRAMAVRAKTSNTWIIQ